HHGREPAPRALLAELRPADQARVRRDLEEGPGVPAAIDVNVLDLRDLHGACVSTRCSSSPPARKRRMFSSTTAATRRPTCLLPMGAMCGVMMRFGALHSGCPALSGS